MTRLKERRRIDHALEHRSERELRWALGYCTMRLSIATRKDHIKHWQKLRRHIEAALEPEALLSRRLPS